MRAGDIVLDINGISFIPSFYFVYLHIPLVCLLFSIYYVFVLGVWSHINRRADAVPQRVLERAEQVKFLVRPKEKG